MCGGSAARKARSVYVAPGGRWRELGGADEQGEEGANELGEKRRGLTVTGSTACVYCVRVQYRPSVLYCSVTSLDDRTYVRAKKGVYSAPTLYPPSIDRKLIILPPFRKNLEKLFEVKRIYA
jgi:hypothetical protein